MCNKEFLDAPLLPDPVIEAYKKHVDRTLLRENLKLTPEQRLDKLSSMLLFQQELKKAGEKLRKKALG